MEQNKYSFMAKSPMGEFQTIGEIRGGGMPVWRNSDHVCALSDSERHIGHAVKIGGRWHAFDATHANVTGDGFRQLGVFATAELAQREVEFSHRMLPLSFAGAA